MTGPGTTAISPTGMPGQLCRPNTASIGNWRNNPSLTMTSAPPSDSSAGWKMKWTVPSKPSRSAFPLRKRAAPNNIAVWPSWPHACICPGCVEQWAKSFISSTGSASMSARRPMLRGLVPRFSTPTTPVPASPRCTSRPQAASSRATRSAVRFSLKASSGWA